VSATKVTLFVDSNGTHLHQIYTGLELLQREGLIDLKLGVGRSITNRRPNRQFIAMEVERKRVSKFAAFDLTDHQEIGIPDALDRCDVYFKRSLTHSSYKSLEPEMAKKLAPFGFNYQVISRSKKLLLKRLLLEYWSRPYNPFKAKNKFHLKNIQDLILSHFVPLSSQLLGVEEFEGKNVPGEFDVFFQCRLWDPNEVANRNRDDAQEVNDSRVKVIRSLKSALGSRFVGGLQPTPYAKVVAPDIVIADKDLTGRRCYLDLVRRSKLVISTAGLLGSNGWKLGEYIALGKAILSEPIVTQVPGEFVDGKHYISYSSADQCVNEVERLLSDRESLESLCVATRQYYDTFLHPRNLMLAHIETALSPADGA